MPKIRAVKPETWTDEKFVELTPLARLLFIGMWNFACDNGHLDDSARQLKMRVLPADDADAEELLGEMSKAGMIVRRDGFIKVVNMGGHQKPDLRFLVFCDHCEHDENATYTPSDRKERTSRARSAPNVPPKRAPRNGDVDVDVDGEVGRGAQARPSRDKRGTRIPDGFAVDDDMRSWAREKGFENLPLETITDEFVDYWRAVPGAKGVKLDWPGTWRNWIRRKSTDVKVVRLATTRGQQPEGW